MTGLVEEWAYGLGMLTAGYWYLMIVGIVAAVYLFARKRRLPGVGALIATFIMLPFVLTAYYQYRTDQHKPWLGEWAGNIGGVPFALTVEDIFANNLYGTITVSPCGGGDFFGSVDGNTVTLIQTNGEFRIDLEGHPSSLAGEASITCAAVDDNSSVRLHRGAIAVASAGAENTFPVNVPNCEKDIPFRIPEGFRPPAGTAETSIRSDILETLHGNTARRARYSTVLMREWNDPYTEPSIVFGTLGTVMQIQGEVDQSFWHGVRAEMARLEADVPALERLMDQGAQNLAEGSQLDIDVREPRLLAIDGSDANRITLLHHTQADANGLAIDVYGGSSFTYVDRCLLFYIISVPADMLDARALAVRFIGETKPAQD